MVNITGLHKYIVGKVTAFCAMLPGHILPENVTHFRNNNTPLALQPNEDQDLSTDCSTYFCLSTDRDKRSFGQFFGRVFYPLLTSQIKISPTNNVVDCLVVIYPVQLQRRNNVHPVSTRLHKELSTCSQLPAGIGKLEIILFAFIRIFLFVNLYCQFVSCCVNLQVLYFCHFLVTSKIKCL